MCLASKHALVEFSFSGAALNLSLRAAYVSHRCGIHPSITYSLRVAGFKLFHCMETWKLTEPLNA